VLRFEGGTAAAPQTEPIGKEPGTYIPQYGPKAVQDFAAVKPAVCNARNRPTTATSAYSKQQKDSPMENQGDRDCAKNGNRKNQPREKKADPPEQSQSFPTPRSYAINTVLALLSSQPPEPTIQERRDDIRRQHRPLVAGGVKPRPTNAAARLRRRNATIAEIHDGITRYLPTMQTRRE